MPQLASADDSAWAPFRAQWRLDPDVAFLNHGSFGLQPLPVQAARLRWLEALNRQPMDFYLAEYEDALTEARDTVADFVGAGRTDLVLVENATYGMNIVAASLPLAAGDEVLLTDHEYGAVARVWNQACERVGAAVVTAPLRLPLTTVEDTVAQLFAAATPRTRLIVISHLTSATAVWLPAREIVAEARRRGIRVAIDGPHAVGTTDLDLAALDVDYYCASCHKWLCAPLGTGFFYAHPRVQAELRAPILSWGRILPAAPQRWQDEYHWRGTQDPSALLTIPDAIHFFADIGWRAVRERTHALVHYAREQMTAWTGLPPISPDSPAWYGPMTTVPLPPLERFGSAALGETLADQCHSLRRTLRTQHKIIAPIIGFNDRPYVRFSCHIYTQREEIDRLVNVLKQLVS